MKKILKLAGAVVGVATVAGTTTYVLTQTESGRQFVRRVKTKVAELQATLAEQLEEVEQVLEEASLTKPKVVVYDYTNHIEEVAPEETVVCPDPSEVIEAVRSTRETE